MRLGKTGSEPVDSGVRANAGSHDCARDAQRWFLEAERVHEALAAELIAAPATTIFGALEQVLVASSLHQIPTPNVLDAPRMSFHASARCERYLTPESRRDQ